MFIVAWMSDSNPLNVGMSHETPCLMSKRVTPLLLLYNDSLYSYRQVYLASSIGGNVMECIFDSRWHFRLTIHHEFIPAWKMAGEVASVAMSLSYAFFFGIPLVILIDHKAALERSLEIWNTPFYHRARNLWGASF